MTQFKTLIREPVRKFCEAFPATLQPAQSFKRLTTLGVGGTADVITVDREESLAALMQLLNQEGIAWSILGGGSNLLADDGFLQRLLIRFEPPKSLRRDGNSVTVSANYNLGKLMMESAKMGLGGLEPLGGIPGSVGGAVKMNAGAFGGEIGTLLQSITLVSPREGIRVVPRAQMHFEYRHSFVRDDELVTSLTLQLRPRPQDEIDAAIKNFTERRISTQPLNQRSAGCIFKNPPGASTGKMIDELGLKGFRIGDAEVSTKHANFLINRGAATAADLFRLMDLIRQRVYDGYQMELEEEVIVFKNSIQ